MNKLYVKYLSIEVTRRCNMACAHCLRGDAQNMNIDHRHIRNVLKHFKHIHQLTITGGEPSLNCKAILYILRQLKHFGIHVYRFYIVTNGSPSSMSEAFIGVCSELYQYQEEDDPGSYMVEISDDKYHDAQHRDQVVATLSWYPFIGLRGQSKFIPLIKSGRCKEGYQDPVHGIYLSSEDYVYGDVYLNAQGKILGGCNQSYEQQDENALCGSGNLRSYLNATLKNRMSKS